MAELRAFVRSIRDDMPVAVGGADALAALRIAEAAARSMHAGRPVGVGEP
ncbi:MAG: Gfo/Idh/MocA family oxidoreductase [Candidatus Limnocylindrales bacterium]